MPSSVSTTRSALIEIHRQRSASLREEMQDLWEEASPELLDYYECYRGHFRVAATSIEESDLDAQLRSSDLLYFGDYHSLAESQRAPLRFLYRLQKHSDLIIATEVVHHDKQEQLELFLSGKIELSDLRTAIDFDKLWGFSWQSYKMQFEFAKKYSIPMLALNCKPKDSPNTLEDRDRFAARLIAQALEKHPDSKIAVLIGDLHICPPHLPKMVDMQVRAKQQRKIQTSILYQNSEQLYWQLAESGLEQQTQILDLGDRQFCLMNTTPWVKYQSYWNWVDNCEELEQSPEDYEDCHSCATIMSDQVLEIIEDISKYFGFNAEEFSDFSVCTSRNLNLLEELSLQYEFSDSEAAELTKQIALGESYYLPSKKLIFLADLSIDHASEEAAHHINCCLSGLPTKLDNPRDDFYYRACKEAIGFLGSLVINHHRPCWQLNDFQEHLQNLSSGGHQKTKEELAEIQICQDCILHLQLEEKWLANEISSSHFDQEIYQRASFVHNGSSHALGYILAQKLYEALTQARLSRRQAADLFREPLEKTGRAEQRYFALLKHCHNHKQLV